ncbi:glycosyltransferase [Pseudomonas sp. zfem002]|uniref:glycosyltransferase n=1 Tax=Pseudomonas sp. zfem002 TaxID=3078197 RepID=UPI0029290251|nr:glycosyltransferase [Pseudomonas sp. zfem002]MDU9394090.1 glycosyltransferase [Pseudomonas sp. zfem002]
MIAVIIPAHNEAEALPRCLIAVQAAARMAQAAGHRVQILLVLDRCSDASAAIARRFAVETLRVDARNVGQARRAGAALMLERGAQWLACTDADSCVPAHWLLCQLAFAVDAVCGTVHVEQWLPEQDAALRERYLQRYQLREGHRHVHGANLGICARAYQRVGGFQPLALNEDVRLVEDLRACGASIVWTARNSVATSARLDPRARGGFGDYLRGLVQSVDRGGC